MEPQIQELPRPSGGGRGAVSVPDRLLAGRYRPIRLLGEGAMGQVFEVEDVVVGDRLAVKRLRSEWVEDAEAVERCRREVRAARGVSHPNVCRVFDLIVDDGSAGRGEVLLTMELVRGETLADRLARRRRLEPEEVLPLVRQLCAGLGAVHAAGIVHRDLKPANILLEPGPPGEPGERVVLTDFGLARCLAPLAPSAPTLTTVGDLVGSPAYLAPEQVRGRPVSPATDVFALGVVLYELLTGVLPFDGETAVETALARLEGSPPALARHVAGLDPCWDRAIRRCLDRDPAQRFRDVSDALSGLTSVPSSASGAATAGRSTVGATLLAALLFVGVGVDGHRAPRQATPDGPEAPRPTETTGRAARAEDLLRTAGERLGAGELAAARELYQRVLVASRAAGDREAEVRALTGLGVVRCRGNDLDQAERLEREALRLARQLGDGLRVANLLNNLGVVVVLQGRLPEAEKLYREAASLYGEAGDGRRRAAALNNLGSLLRRQGYLAEAEATHLESLALRRGVGDRRGEGVTLLGLGRLATLRNRPVEARGRLGDALRILRQEGHPDGVAETLTALAEAELAGGDRTAARQALEEAAMLARTKGYPRWEAEVARVGALVSLAEGRSDEAVLLARRSLLGFEELFDAEGKARSGVVLARALVAAGDGELARELLTRLEGWQWVRQDRSLRLTTAAVAALADRDAGAAPSRVEARLESAAGEAALHGLGQVERRVRAELADHRQEGTGASGGAVLAAVGGLSP